MVERYIYGMTKTHEYSILENKTFTSLCSLFFTGWFLFRSYFASCTGREVFDERRSVVIHSGHLAAILAHLIFEQQRGTPIVPIESKTSAWLITLGTKAGYPMNLDSRQDKVCPVQVSLRVSWQ